MRKYLVEYERNGEAIATRTRWASADCRLATEALRREAKAMFGDDTEIIVKEED